MTRQITPLITAALFLLSAGARAQDWQSSSNLPGIDLSGLTAAQKASVLRVIRSEGCSCGCDMRMAECRVKDPKCDYSLGMSKVIIDAIKSGKSEQQAFDAAKASQWGHVPEPKLLEDPVPVPIEGSPVLGPPNAKITIVEFSDFQCPYCILAVPEIRALLKAYPAQSRLVFKQFPLDIHTRAFLAATAALAANKQGKFWQMHDALFQHHDDLSRDTVSKIAQSLGMDVPRFEADLTSQDVKQAVEKDVKDGDQAGVQGTPTIFINGQRYNGAITLEALKPIFEAAIGGQPKAQTASIH